MIDCKVLLMLLLALIYIDKYIAESPMKVLKQVLNGPLKDKDICLIVDPGITDLDLNDIIRYKAQNGSTIIYHNINQHSGDFFKALELHYERGNSIVHIIVFKTLTREFIESLESDWKWNPDYLILFNFETKTGIEYMINIMKQELFQRSKYMVLFYPVKKMDSHKYMVSTVDPFEQKENLSLQYINLWDSSIFRKADSMFVDRFTNFKGVKLMLGSFCDDYPFVYEIDGDCFGFSVDNLDVIGSYLNFTYDVQYRPIDGMWGGFENGSWTGLLADIAYRGKDLVVNSFLLTEERNAGFSYTYPYHAEGFAFILPNPLPIPLWMSITYPFHWVVWCSIVGLVIIVMMVLMVLMRGTLTMRTDNSHSVFLVIIAGLVRQSTSFCLGREEWLKIWMLIWWLVSLVLSTAYSCNLIAFLTVPQYPKTIQEVDGLVEAGLRAGLQDIGNFVPYQLKSSPDPSLKYLGDHLDLFPYFDSTHDFMFGYDMVHDRTHALMETYSYLAHTRWFLNQTKTTYIMKEQVYPGYITWILPKNSQLTPKLTVVLQRIYETGIVGNFYKKHMEIVLGEDNKSIEKVSDAKPLRIEQLQGAFFLLIFGLSLAFMAFAAEWVSIKVFKK